MTISSISRYRLSQHEDGLWHVIDTRTGGPAAWPAVRKGEFFFLGCRQTKKPRFPAL